MLRFNIIILYGVESERKQFSFFAKTEIIFINTLRAISEEVL